MAIGRAANSGLHLAALLLAALSALAQGQAALPSAPPTGSVLVDQAVAVVNGDLILESDIDEERRWEAFQPVREVGETFSRQTTVDRLIDRQLILQQAKQQPENQVTLDTARAALEKLRKDIPACKQFHCETDAGWQKFVEAQGFTVPEVEQRERTQLEILHYIEIRFRAGIHITPEQIKDYYDHTLVPKETRLKATAPPLDTISDQIEQILMEEQVSNLLGDWLKSLKAQGTVRMMKPEEGMP
jgi:hypothetical protein